MVMTSTYVMKAGMSGCWVFVEVWTMLVVGC